MKQFLLGLSISLAFILGCVTAAAITSPANADATAAAGTTSTLECFGATTWVVPGKALNAGEIPKTVRVPEGWQIVGSGGDSGLAVIVLCRPV